jgi:hypothetical protein
VTSLSIMSCVWFILAIIIHLNSQDTTAFYFCFGVAVVTDVGYEIVKAIKEASLRLEALIHGNTYSN